jgi:hypothetical protein
VFVLAEARMELAVADVEGDHARGAGLKETIREAARRGPDVEAVLAAHIELEGGESVSELLPAARDEARPRLDLERGRLVELLACLRVSPDAAREHERLRLRTGLGQAALDEQHVQPLLRHSERVTP